MNDSEDSRFENVRLEVLREVDKIRGGIEKDVADIRNDVGNHVTEVKNDIKNLKWFFGIAFAALFGVFSIMLGVLAYLANTP